MQYKGKGHPAGLHRSEHNHQLTHAASEKSVSHTHKHTLPSVTSEEILIILMSVSKVRTHTHIKKKKKKKSAP